MIVLTPATLLWFQVCRESCWKEGPWAPGWSQESADVQSQLPRGSRVSHSSDTRERVLIEVLEIGLGSWALSPGRGSHRPLRTQRGCPLQGGAERALQEDPMGTETPITA